MASAHGSEGLATRDSSIGIEQQSPEVVIIIGTDLDRRFRLRLEAVSRLTTLTLMRRIIAC